MPERYGLLDLEHIRFYTGLRSNHREIYVRPTRQFIGVNKSKYRISHRPAQAHHKSHL